MADLCAIANKNCVVDFVCPYNLYRKDYDITVWMNTIESGRFEDTNKVFEKPEGFILDYEITDFNYDHIIKEIRDRSQ